MNAGGYQDRFGWYAALSAYWLASSFKWFALLTVVLPHQIAMIVPEGTKNGAWGMVFALGALWATVGPSLFGALSDRSGRRANYIVAGAALTLLGLLVLGIAGSIATIGLGYLLIQIADDVGSGPCGALIPQYVPKDRRGRASGVLSLLSLVGQLAAAPVAYLWGSQPRAAYLAIGLVTLVGALVASRTVADLEHGLAVRPQGPFLKDFLRGWVSPWRDRNFMWVWVGRLLFALGLYLVQPYLRNYLEDVIRAFRVLSLRFGTADQATAVLVLTITVFAALGSVAGGALADRIGHRRVVLSGGAAMALTLLPFLLVRRFDALLGVGAAFGAGYGIYLSADWALASDVMPNAQALGRDMGVWQASDSFVQMFAGSAGRLVDWGNTRRMGTGYEIVFSLGAAAFVAGLAAVSRVRNGKVSQGASPDSRHPIPGQ